MHIDKILKEHLYSWIKKRKEKFQQIMEFLRNDLSEQKPKYKATVKLSTSFILGIYHYTTKTASQQRSTSATVRIDD